MSVVTEIKGSPNAAANRFKSIRNKFEQMTVCQLDHLDISGQNTMNPVKKEPPFLFRRSATTLNLTAVRDNKENESRKSARLDFIRSSSNKLNRHTSDPIKRSSIKRSPAFRVGESHSKVVLTKSISLNSEEVGLTDTLKKALKQPLPRGPPPKKPPRLLANSPSATEKPFPIQEEKPDTSSSENSGSSNWHKFTTNVKTNLNEFAQHLSKTASCINSGPIYDDVYNGSAPEPIYMEPFQHLKHPPVPEHKNQRRFSMDSVLDRKTLDRNITAPKKKKLLSRQLAQDHKEIHEDGEEMKSINGSVSSTCSCPEQLNGKQPDLHYMCTDLSDKVTGRDEFELSSTENDGLVSLGNTYDEINILLNAAFNKKVIDDHLAIVSKEERNNELDSMGNNIISNMDQTSPQKQSVKVTRSLTEKRKDYVRRISIKTPEAIPQLVAQYGSLNQTFKSPVKTFQTTKSLDEDAVSPNAIIEPTSERIKKFQKIIKENEEKRDIEKKNDAMNENLLFQSCLLVGFNLSTNLPYIKVAFPKSGAHPQNVERLVFPTKNLLNQKKSNQEYGLILTDNNGKQVYGYCRRVLPENCDYCLPLAYCIITRRKAPGFYFKLLKEIESRHGQPEGNIMTLLKNLQQCHMPEPGKFLYLKLQLLTPISKKGLLGSNHKISPKRLSLEANPKWLTESMKSNDSKDLSTEKDFSIINRSLMVKKEGRIDEILIRRPSDLRLESTELAFMYDSLGTELLLHAFSSLLHERKVILVSKNISTVTNCILGLQTILYPFKWQYTLITILPDDLLEICQAPFPVLAGTFSTIDYELEDGLVIDLDKKVLVQKCGDEVSILPNTLRSSLLMSLEMVNLIDQGKMLSNVLIAEAFLRFFVELFSNYKGNPFDKDTFTHSHPIQSVNLFLEWFVETSLFRHFLNNKLLKSNDKKIDKTMLDISIDEHYYSVFEAKLLEKSQNNSKTDQNIENIVKNCKLINKKGMTFKDRLKHFFD